MDEIKIEALRIASHAGEPIAETMKRAAAYEDFLRGSGGNLPGGYLKTAEQQLLNETKKWVGT